MTAWTDPYQQSEAAGWDIQDGSLFSKDMRFAVDVVIIGSGAGGGISAEILARAGKKVLLIEEGALRSSAQFAMDEGKAYRELYQEGMTRSTRDGSISLLQGKTVGGSTTVNWTSSFRTPEATLDHWRERWGLSAYQSDDMAPLFAKLEEQLGIHTWSHPNANNQVIARGCQNLGWTHAAISRNVRACWNLGACGLGCPTNAKQSTLVQSIPVALRYGATLLHRVRAERLEVKGDRVMSLEARALDVAGQVRSLRVSVTATHFILAAGAIGTPALLLRSASVPNPYRLTGTRTFLHPSVFVFGQFTEAIAAYSGAPQSIYTDQFQWRDGVSGPMGYKIETVPLFPLFASLLMRGHGQRHWQRLQQLPETSGLLALLRDGFHEDSPGGRVDIDSKGAPLLDYPLTPYLFDGVRRAYLSMTELLFAAGAQKVHLAHSDSRDYTSWSSARAAIQAFRYEAKRFRLGSAHLMGGCRMGGRAEDSVVDVEGRHHQLANLYVCDGSIFPSSVGANPQLSIFAFSAKIAQLLLSKS